MGFAGARSFVHLHVSEFLGPTFLKIVFLVVVLLGGGGDKVLGLVADGQMGGTA